LALEHGKFKTVQMTHG